MVDRELRKPDWFILGYYVFMATSIILLIWTILYTV
jgi:hypothetical protein